MRNERQVGKRRKVLTARERAEVRRLHYQEGVWVVRLAYRFGVSESTVSRVINERR